MNAFKNTWKQNTSRGGAVKLLAVAVVFVAIQAGATVAYTDIEAYNYPVGLPGNGQSGVYTIGNAFTVNSPITVDDLGMFDANGIPSTEPISVAIYSISAVADELQSATLAVNPVSFSALNPGTLLPGTSTRVLSVPSVTLHPGTYMVVANNYGGSGALPYYDTTHAPMGLISGNTGGGAVSFLGSYKDNGVIALGATLPDLSDWGYFDTQLPRMAAGNFSFTFTIVPEAGLFGGAVAVLLGLVYGGRCLWQGHQRRLASLADF